MAFPIHPTDADAPFEPIPEPTVLLPGGQAGGGVGGEPDEALDVVAVGAHPDDVEFACGGTLAKLVRQGYRVGIIDLTDGQPTPYCDAVATRMAEAVGAAEILGVAVRVQLNLPNRRLIDGFVPRVALARQFRRWRPRLVIGFGDKTPMHSPDHWQAMQITDAAVFYSRLCRWEEHFPGQPVHAVRQQLYFRMALEPEVMPGQPHHLIVNIAETLDAKIDAIAAYASQFDHKPGIAERVRAAAVVSGAAAGCQAGESFVAARPFAVDDLVATVLNLSPPLSD